MKFPRKLFANVLLLDDKIINFKIGDRSWEGDKWCMNRQPSFLFLLENADQRIESKIFAKIVNSNAENTLFFRKISTEFFKMFEISDRYPRSMHKPY